VAKLRPTLVPRDVEERLRAVGPGLLGRDALILPTQSRNGETYYLADDVDALRTARAAGLDASYLVGPDERRYLNEFGAGWGLEMALAVAQNLAANGVGAVIAYVWARARLAIRMGRHPGPESDVPVRLRIARLEYDGQGGVKVEGLKIDGSVDGATAQLKTILAGPAAVSGSPVTALAELPAEDQDGEAAVR
jgi:hypothetical protein